jgi:hypothetical protein
VSQTPAEALRQQISNISVQKINDIYFVPPGVDGSIGLSDKQLDAIMELVTAYAATVEREALKALRDKMTIFPPNGVYEASMFAVTVNDIDDRLAALTGKAKQLGKESSDENL